MLLSTATDIVSYKIMEKVYNNVSNEELLQQTAELMYEKIPWVDWCGIYCLHSKEFLAVSDQKKPSSLSDKDITAFEISSPPNKTPAAALCVRHLEPLSYGTYQELTTLAQALGEGNVC
jgi:hypothetical protein